MAIEAITSLASRYTAAWCSQNASSVASFFEDQGSLTINEGAPSTGRVAITATAQGFMTAFPDLVLRMDGLTQTGPRFVYRWTLTGTHGGPGGTGQKVLISGFEEWDIGATGLIAHSLGHFDEADYNRQVTGRG